MQEKKGIKMKNLNGECPKFNNCAIEHHLILDGNGSLPMIRFYEEEGSNCFPCRNHYEEEKAIRELIRIKWAKIDVPSQLEKNIKGIIE